MWPSRHHYNKILAARYEFYPTLKYFPARSKEKDTLEQFGGSLDKDAVVEWIRGNISETLTINGGVTSIESPEAVCENTPFDLVPFLCDTFVETK